MFQVCYNFFTLLEIMYHSSEAGPDFKIIPVGFNAPLEPLTGFTFQSIFSLSPPLRLQRIKVSIEHSNPQDRRAALVSYLRLTA